MCVHMSIYDIFDVLVYREGNRGSLRYNGDRLDRAPHIQIGTRGNVYSKLICMLWWHSFHFIYGKPSKDFSRIPFVSHVWWIHCVLKVYVLYTHSAKFNLANGPVNLSYNLQNSQ